jgi:hypothetical protein
MGEGNNDTALPFSPVYRNYIPPASSELISEAV